jgi:hypothetical protein
LVASATPGLPYARPDRRGCRTGCPEALACVASCLAIWAGCRSTAAWRHIPTAMGRRFRR